MLNKIEHLGIAVIDLDKANVLYTNLLGVAPYKSEIIESEFVVTSFFKIGETKIELLQALSSESAIAKFIEKKGEGIHHIAYDVDDITQSIALLKEQGFQILNENPKQGADNKMVAFVHPKSVNGVLTELCMDKDKFDLESI